MAEESRRTGRWIPIVYYYLATVIGLIILLVGLIQGLRGLARAAFPQLAPEVRFLEPIGAPEFAEAKPPPEPGAVRPIRERSKVSARELAQLAKQREERRRDALHNARLGGFGDALQGLVVVVVGAPVFFWHLRQARRKEPEWMGLAPAPAPEPPPPAPQAPPPAPQAPPTEGPGP